MKNKLIVIGMLVLTACGTTKMLSQSDVEKGSAMYPGLTLEQLQKGKADYEKNCNMCHSLKKPGSRSGDAWQRIVPQMAHKAQQNAGKEVIDNNTQQSILKYLVTMGAHKKK